MRTTAAIQQFLDDLAGVRGESPAEPIVRDLIARSARRLHLLCNSMLHRRYPRLARPPLNLKSDEMLSSVVVRLLKALREARPQNVRQFFALANRHMRWELNELARQLDQRGADEELRDAAQPEPASHPSGASAGAQRILAAIERLPEDEREAFSLVQIQGMAQTEAAEVLGVSTKTIQRRIRRCVSLLAEELGDLEPGQAAGA